MRQDASVQKTRRLQAAAGPSGVFRILAVDHRGVLLRMMDPERGQVPAERVTRLKLAIVRKLGHLATAVILDPEYGAPQAIAAGAIPEGVGLLVPLESQIHGASPGSVQPRPSWSVRQAREAGAIGVKLYLSYHPDAGERARLQEDLVRDVVCQCEVEGLPLFLEPVPYSIDPGKPVGSPEFAAERLRIQLETVDRLGQLGPDVFKLPFPCNVQHETDRRAWFSACAALDEASPVPWALLSAGEPFDTFTEQLRIACGAGCSGFMAGRSVWGEAATAADDERIGLLDGPIAARMRTLTEIADRFARPVFERGKPLGTSRIV